MAQLFGSYFPHLVVGLMLLFMLILGSLSIGDALRGRRN
ncbi:hypothetical protein L288_07250 [Sphingobium quisquiliarum P25]|uniref:Uncharacterized protein n=1 Tax=Sphingobium quisquiliarum P25 TaxID=1329909 RepID=T0GXX4_9SPHN|nr:hypothetical protein L288_07250 [Sphingobium quisquiliarum P25]